MGKLFKEFMPHLSQPLRSNKDRFGMGKAWLTKIIQAQVWQSL